MDNFQFSITVVTLLLYFVVQIGFIEGIIGGHEASLDQFKYHLSLQTAGEHICGAAIISNYHALTAAHCVIDDDDAFKQEMYSIVAGVIDAYDKSSHRIEVDVHKIYVPKEFKLVNLNPGIKYHETGDIAVLKLKHSVSLGPKLNKLDLPTADKINTEDNQNAIITGFGSDSFSAEEDEGYSNLKFAETFIISNEKCNPMYVFPIYDKHLCAKVKQHEPEIPEGVCTGDSGGPLVLHGNIIVGVLVRSPIRCNEQKYAAIYTRVSLFLDFIQNALKETNLHDVRVATYERESI